MPPESVSRMWASAHQVDEIQIIHEAKVKVILGTLIEMLHHDRLHVRIRMYGISNQIIIPLRKPAPRPADPHESGPVALAPMRGDQVIFLE